MPDVLSLGTFDSLHPGHLGLFRLCREMAAGGNVIAGLNTDEFVEKFKHVTPIFTLAERLLMARSCRYVDRVLINSGRGQPELILEALPAGGLLVIGADWAGRDYLAQIGLKSKRKFLVQHNIELRYVPRTGDWSTTEIRERLVRDA
jgi:glycerol-3-phosphate cytidylyltransferase